MKKNLLLLLILSVSALQLRAQCSAPTDLLVTSSTSNSITLGWTENNANVTEWMIEINPAGSAPGSGNAIYTQTNPFVIDGLICGAAYEIYLHSVCSPTEMSTPIMITYTNPTCYALPQNLSNCANSNGLVCFNLNDNDNVILGNHDPNDHVITYYSTLIDAQNNSNPIASPYCINQNEVLYSRLTKISDPSVLEINSFNVVVAFYQQMPALPVLVECDADSNGIINYDLTTAQAILSTTNSLSYYTSFANATNLNNPISTPSNYSLNATVLNSTIYVREIVPNGCDLIYPRTLVAQANCNAASNCGNANSLCNSLGAPFLNTTGMGSLGSAGCLGSTPNPTWFYLPIATSGTINLEIKQGNNAPTYDNQDVDYIVYGPFSNPMAACNQYGANNIVSCSYSASAIEHPVIQNAQAGEYYLLMVTNFSNNSGFISISDLPTSTGSIDCTGFTFISFLDINNNGIQDVGELNFPLGSLTYEQNNDGVIHNITNPEGIFNIYDTNGTSNTYDVSFNVLSNYSSNYTVSTNYTAISPSAGMTTYYFPIVPTQTYDDLSVAIVPVNQPRPGFNYINKVIYANLGNQTIVSGTVTFTKPSPTTIAMTNPSTTATATGFTYNFTNLLPFEIRTIDVDLSVPVVPTVNAGDILVSEASIAPIANDIILANNDATLSSIVVNAYDPNDKMESHGPEIVHSSFTSEDYLFYTIRFENTGNASAINIRVEDYLNNMLDENTLEMVSASHTYEMDRINKHMVWKFNNIMLPVSQPNSTIGKGYITFKIKPMPGYAIGDIIPNTASIYFDFNPAIVTNTFETEFVSALSTGSFTFETVQIYPNPAHDILTISTAKTTLKKIVIYDIVGHKIIEKDSFSNSQVLDVSSLTKGIYLLELISNENDRMLQKIIIK
ncbi:T9SS type A sorting domain-containing protein [Flavobacterium sp. J27]|uniref:T9SS type A sorting domain-containing protein n=1 Tax=Flavobacterium sp. J27 TaxID=2060419 RepID=UPI00103210A3|nr:T9SS type A sorting domain-containing protein [Flavobacterium sp. J27]